MVQTINPIKHFLMLQMWRFGQIYQPISMVLIALTFAGTIYEYISWRINNTFLGISMILLGLLVIVAVIGFVWDKKLRMWNEAIIVSARRSPYTRLKLTPKEILIIEKRDIPLLRALNRSEDADFLEKWVRLEKSTDFELSTDVSKMECSVQRVI